MSTLGAVFRGLSAGIENPIAEGWVSGTRKCAKFVLWCVRQTESYV